MTGVLLSSYDHGACPSRMASSLDANMRIASRSVEIMVPPPVRNARLDRSDVPAVPVDRDCQPMENEPFVTGQRNASRIGNGN